MSIETQDERLDRLKIIANLSTEQVEAIAKYFERPTSNDRYADIKPLDGNLEYRYGYVDGVVKSGGAFVRFLRKAKIMYKEQSTRRSERLYKQPDS